MTEKLLLYEQLLGEQAELTDAIVTLKEEIDNEIKVRMAEAGLYRGPWLFVNEILLLQNEQTAAALCQISVSYGNMGQELELEEGAWLCLRDQPPAVKFHNAKASNAFRKLCQNVEEYKTPEDKFGIIVARLKSLRKDEFRQHLLEVSVMELHPHYTKEHKACQRQNGNASGNKSAS